MVYEWPSENISIKWNGVNLQYSLRGSVYINSPNVKAMNNLEISGNLEVEAYISLCIGK